MFVSLFLLWIAQDVVVQEDLVFAQRGPRELKLDLARPKEDGGRRPLIVCIHGGGWQGGSRNGHTGTMMEFARLGFVSATLEYRFSQEAVWPAQLDDVREGVSFLRERAKDFGIDPERIGVIGDSAGGHLALMLGLRNEERSLGIRAVANVYGPTALGADEYRPRIVPIIEALVGGKREERGELIRSASPIEYVDRHDASILTIHGTEDAVVPYKQAERLEAKLQESKVPNRLLRIEGGQHGFKEKELAKIRPEIDAFFAKLLKPESSLIAYEDFDQGLGDWTFTDDSAWKLEDDGGDSCLSLVKKRSDYKPKVRSPLNIALWQTEEVADFVFEADLCSTNEVYGHQDLCLFFGYQDPSHFYYVHLGRNADAHANSIFLVNDAPRVSIAAERTDGTDWGKGWHRARIVRKVGDGSIEVYFDDMTQPVMKAVDKTFGRGKVGVGSFDDTGRFDVLRLYAKKD